MSGPKISCETADDRLRSCGLSRQCGGGLVEQLLALAILSTVMLGLIGLQQQLLREQQWQWRREKVLWLSRGLLESANLSAAANYSYRSDSTADRTDCSRRRCSPAQMAAHDLAHWQGLVRELMPDAELEVSGGPGGYGLSVSYSGIGGRRERLELGR